MEKRQQLVEQRDEQSLERVGVGKSDPTNAVPAVANEGEERPYRVLADFYGRLTLTAEDQAMLEAKRGLSAWTCEHLGFRSNGATNKPLLLDLTQRWEVRELVQNGLWQIDQERAKPNPQYHGWGLVRRAREANGEPTEEWGWTNPVLIPYRALDGRLLGLRPHKGGPRRTACARPRLYVPRLPEKEQAFEQVVITEGEFKAAALWQMCGQGAIQYGEEPVMGVCALPGIQMAHTPDVMEDLIEYLDQCKAKRVIIVFDNQDKGTPGLPGYKAEWSKRFDADIWAKVLAVTLARKCRLTSKVGRLPDAWRDAEGKADWDGAISQMLRGTVPVA